MWLDKEKPAICLEDLESLLQLRGLTHPLRRGDITIKGILVSQVLMLLETIRGYPKTPSTPLSIRQREGSGFSKNLPKRHDSTSTLSGWLVPTL